MIERLQQARMGIGAFARASLLTALIVGIIGVRYLSGTQTWTLGQGAYFFSLLIGQFFSLSFLLYVIVGWPLAKMKLRKCAMLWVFVVTLLTLVLLVADTFVYEQFRLHINLAMLEMTFLGGGQIVVFSPQMVMQIALMVLGLALLAAGVVFVSIFYQAPKRLYGSAITVMLIAFVCANLTYAVAFPVKNTSVLTATERVPYAQPLRMTKILLKTGIISKEDIRKVKTYSVSDSSSFQYPLKALECTGDQKPMNIVFIYVDSMRHDVFNEKNTPNMWRFSQTKDTSVFTNHYSGGNCTRTGIFSTFYGIPGKYWASALSSNTPSAMMTALQQRGFEIGTFASATLTKPEFHATVFSGVNGIRLDPRGSSSFERDQFSVDDFIHWENQLTGEKPFFSFIFLDNAHACNVHPDEKYQPFKPFWKSVNQLELNNDTDPTEYFNRYRNSVYWVDDQIGRVLDHLKEKSLLDNTIVVLSSDHAEEFNDNKLNYWAHNGNYTDAQIKIPLVVHWPGKASREVSAITSSEDLVATLLPEILGCKNPVKDYSTGVSIWDENRTRNWFHSASYSTNAFVEPERIVFINQFGVLEFQDKTARPAKDESMPSYLKDALEELTRYYRK